jgi:hypothetical protein
MTRKALVVGINRYPYLKDSKGNAQHLTSPAADAAEIDSLMRKGLFEVTRLPETFTDEAMQVDEKGTLKKETLQREISKLFNPEDGDVPTTALLFFAGHGLQETLPRNKVQGYLATSDADNKRIYGVSFDWLLQELIDSPVKNQIVWLDCCHSGEFTNLIFDQADAENRGQKNVNRLFIAACRESETAYGGIKGHGLLTYLLLKGLNQAQDKKGDWITSKSLDAFIHAELKRDQNLSTFQQRFRSNSYGEPIEFWPTSSPTNNSSLLAAKRDGKLPELFKYLIHLIPDEDLPEDISDKLSDLFKIKNKPIESINDTLDSYLIATVEYYTYPKEVLLNAWLVIDNSVPVEDKSRFIPLIDIDIDQNQTQPGVVCQFKQMPEQLDKFIEKSRKLLSPKIYNLTIEVFLPTRLMYMDVDSWKIFDPRTNEETMLGVKYPIRLRSLERLSRKYLEDARPDWCQQWDRVKNIAPDQQNQELFEHLDQMENFNWRLLRMNLTEKIGLKLTCAPPQTKMKDLFKAILGATTPIAIWTRCHVDHCDLAAEIDRILTLNNLSRLCESVQKVRAEADAQRLDDPTLDHLGFHLSLLWEDPYLIPPYHPTGGGE